MRTVEIRRDRAELRTLIVPGLNGSSAGHWQSIWQDEHPEYERVVPSRWTLADLSTWGDSIACAIESHSGPVILVAHGFGCLAALTVQRRLGHRIRGALLVAPSDPSVWGLESRLSNVSARSSWIVVASTDDRWMAFDRARGWASAWSCRFMDAGNVGHIDEHSGHGDWPAGRRLLARLRADVRVVHDLNEVSLAA